MPLTSANVLNLTDRPLHLRAFDDSVTVPPSKRAVKVDKKFVSWIALHPSELHIVNYVDNLGRIWKTEAEYNESNPEAPAQALAAPPPQPEPEQAAEQSAQQPAA